MPGPQPPSEPLLGLPFTGLAPHKIPFASIGFYLGLSGPGVLGEVPPGKKTSNSVSAVLISAFVPAPLSPLFPNFHLLALSQSENPPLFLPSLLLLTFRPSSPHIPIILTSLRTLPRFGPPLSPNPDLKCTLSCPHNATRLFAAVPGPLVPIFHPQALSSCLPVKTRYLS